MSESPETPPFDPVPVRSRRDGWTPERQRAFILALARSLCVDRAAAKVGMSRESVYRLRKRAGAESFAAAWNSVMAAKPRGSTALDLLFHRAFYGSLKPIVRGGQTVAFLHRPDNRALMSLLHRMDQSQRSSERMRQRLKEKGHGEIYPHSKGSL